MQEPYGTNTVVICLYAEITLKFVFAAEYLQFISSLSKNYIFQIESLST